MSRERLTSSTRELVSAFQIAFVNVKSTARIADHLRAQFISEHCQTGLCNRRYASLMNLLLTILTLSGMSTSGSLRVKHATCRRDLLGSRRAERPRSDAVLNTLSLDGTWVLAAETPRGALKDFLVSVGAPRVFAGPLAKAFDADAIQLDVIDKNGNQSIAVATPKRSWSLPIKLNTNAIYHTNQDTIVATPRGNQQAKMRPSPTRGDVTIVKRGPAEGERVLERYRAVDEGHIEQELTHVPASGERVVVRRTFMRAA